MTNPPVPTGTGAPTGSSSPESGMTPAAPALNAVSLALGVAGVVLAVGLALFVAKLDTVVFFGMAAGLVIVAIVALYPGGWLAGLSGWPESRGFGSTGSPGDAVERPPE